MPLDFDSYPFWMNAVLLTVTAALIWHAGTQLSRDADIIADRSGLGQELIGLLLLAGATSLPEIATTVTASASGEARLATNNLLGGIAMQTALLAVADLLVVAGALTYFTPRPSLVLQGVMLVGLLGLTLAGIAAGEPVTLFGIGLWPVLLFAAYLAAVDQIRRSRGHERWQVRARAGERELLSERAHEAESERRLAGQAASSWSNTRLALSFAVYSLITLAAGWSIAGVSSALAVQTGLGQSFVGATLVAITTSLPEVSTTLSACRQGSYALAISNIFGSNAILIALLLAADVLYREGPVMEAVDRPAQFAAALAIVVTCLYVWGLQERRDRTILGMGIDSALVLTTYLGGLIILYLLR